jgi:hypothetical protein
MTKLTVLTPTLKEDDDFERTFNSLRYLSNARELNWIVLKKSERRAVRTIAPGCVMISGPDRGIYDALNAGLRVCETSFFQVVGSGDTVIAENEAQALTLISDLDAIYTFPILYGPTKRLEVPNPDGLTLQMTCPHPGIICPLHKAVAVDGFSLTYHIASDYDFLCRLAKSGMRFYKSTTLPIVHFKGGGVSDSSPLICGLENALVKKRVWNQSDPLILKELILFLGYVIRGQ